VRLIRRTGGAVSERCHTDALLELLALKLRCEHVVVHAPSLLAEEVKSTRVDADIARLDALVRYKLWPMVRRTGRRKVLNRVRPSEGAPVLPLRIMLCPLLDGSTPIGVVVALRESNGPPFERADIDALSAEVPALRTRLSQRIEPNTGLLCRPDFETEVKLRWRPPKATCVVYGNLDRINALNEIQGFSAGDAVIEQVACLWQKRLQSDGSIATHLSGDRFVAVLFGQTLNRASDWAEFTRQEIESLRVCDDQARVTASFGVAPLGGSFHHALAAAESACRVAKARGRNRVEIYESVDRTVARRHAEARASRAIMEALEEDRYVLHAQKIVPLTETCDRAHYEILLRIRQSDGKLISVGEYLQAAERYQLLERLDRWVVQRAVQTLSQHAGSLCEQRLSFAINITGQSLSQPAFADFVRAEIERHGIPARLVDFEFTETAAVRNLVATRRFIECVRDVGAHIALDDFGAGLSSLVLLKHLNVHRIKIDGQFVRDILDNPRSRALVGGLGLIASQLNLETVAVYVETKAIAEYLRGVGITYAQGHCFGFDEPLTDILASLCGAGDARERGARAGEG